MKRMWTMLAVLVGLLSDSSRADEIDAALQQARKACRRRGGGVVVIERGDTEWRVVDLTLYGNSLTDTDLEQIGELRTLESLKLGGKARATDEGWRRLSTLPQLKHLTLPPNVTAEGLRALSALKELESLDLIACRGLRDPAPADLTRFRSLRRLTLPAVVVSDAQLVHVKALRNLEELGMSSDGDVDLSGFVPLSDLRSLVIYELGASGATALKSLRSSEV